jgi:carbamoyl-phosphate synthase large subunit
MISKFKTHILMTGAGAPGGPGILHCLQKDTSLFITVADINVNASGRYLNISGAFWNIPDAKDDLFIGKVLSYCIQHNVDIIFPLVTLELFKFAANKELFNSKGIKIIVSDFNYLNISNNKSTLLNHLKVKGVTTPNFRVVASSDFKGLVQAFYDLGYPNQALVFKPSISNGSRGVRIIDNNINKFELLFNHKPNSLYMTFDEMCTILQNSTFPELLVTEYLPGEEYSVDTMIYQGRIDLVIPRIRTRTMGGISVEGQFRKQDEIIKYSREVLSCMHLHGPIGLQIKKAIDGQFKILEINPRIQGTSVAALGLGINLPLIAVYQEMDKVQDFNNDIIKWETHFIRYWKELFY